MMLLLPLTVGRHSPSIGGTMVFLDGAHPYQVPRCFGTNQGMEDATDEEDAMEWEEEPELLG